MIIDRKEDSQIQDIVKYWRYYFYILFYMIHIFIFVTLVVATAFFITDSDAKSLYVTIGTDMFQAQYKQQRYKFDDYNVVKTPYKNISRISLALSYKPFEKYYIFITARSNRLINNLTQTTATDTVGGDKVIVLQKLIADSLIISTAIHKRIMPFVVATNATSKNYIIYNNNVSVTSKINTILYGGGMTLLITNKHSISFTYFIGNKDFNTKRAFGVSYNYRIL